jgi:hypothetical protein
MSTYLQLCQDVARESGVISGTNPTTVLSQNGRLLKIVEWTAQAWVNIQNLHADWRWMQKTFSGAATSGSGQYTAASWSITDLRDWLRDNRETGYQPHTIYLTATGVSGEGALREISWQQWRTTYGRGSQTNNYPSEYAISPAGEFSLGPIPDDDYTVQGEYRQAAVVMTVDGDTPALPAAFDQIIVWQAIMLLAEFDEAVEQRAAAILKYNALLEDLQRDQLPVVSLGGLPIA